MPIFSVITIRILQYALVVPFSKNLIRVESGSHSASLVSVTVTSELGICHRHAAGQRRFPLRAAAAARFGSGSAGPARNVARPQSRKVQSRVGSVRKESEEELRRCHRGGQRRSGFLATDIT